MQLRHVDFVETKIQFNRQTSTAGSISASPLSITSPPWAAFAFKSFYISRQPSEDHLDPSRHCSHTSSMAGNIYERPLEPINTSHSYFLKQDSNPNLPPISVMLRGVNLSSTSKFPSWSTPRPYAHKTGLSRTERDELREWDAGVQTQIANPERLWSEAEKGGHDGWFVGHPLQEDGMEVSCALA